MPVEIRTGAAEAAHLSPAQHVALWCLKGYKLLLSPLFAGSCRFLPSCSEYAREAVVTHGVVKGSWLAVRRLARCHPFGGSGLDSVPPHRTRHPSETDRQAVGHVGDLADSPRV
jgi:putative membrane protein insertion efficiency factor